jgi:hypothetical protein
MVELNKTGAGTDVLPLPATNDSSPVNRYDARKPLFVIEPLRGWAALELRTLWSYRELLYFLVWRDVKVRYKQTVLGAHAFERVLDYVFVALLTVGIYGWLLLFSSRFDIER